MKHILLYTLSYVVVFGLSGYLNYWYGFRQGLKHGIKFAIQNRKNWVKK